MNSALTPVLTGSITFVAGMVSQFLGHRLTQRRENMKSLKEGISQLYSPLSIEIYKYLELYGEESRETDIGKYKLKEKFEESWEQIRKLVTDNKQIVTMELTHNFKQTNNSINNSLEFFMNFFNDFIKVSKKAHFKGKIDKYTPKEMFYILKLYKLLNLHYGHDALYIFRIMQVPHSLSFEKVFKKLRKGRLDFRNSGKNPFDQQFEILVLNALHLQYHRDEWKQLIEKH